MAFASAASDRPALADINVTPLVDVMLVLLIIFMVTAPLLDHRLSLTLPSRTPEASKPPVVLALEVQPGDVLSLEGQLLAPAALEAELARRHAEQPDLVLQVRVGGEVDYQGATTALSAADRAGITNIRLD